MLEIGVFVSNEQKKGIPSHETAGAARGWDAYVGF